MMLIYSNIHLIQRLCVVTIINKYGTKIVSFEIAFNKIRTFVVVCGGCCGDVVVCIDVIVVCGGGYCGDDGGVTVVVCKLDSNG